MKDELAAVEKLRIDVNSICRYMKIMSFEYEQSRIAKIKEYFSLKLIINSEFASVLASKGHNILNQIETVLNNIRIMTC